MRWLYQSSLVVVALMALNGCASAGDPSAAALSKAASDLNCPDSEVRVTSLGNNKYSARGCGRYVAYEGYGPRTLAGLGSR
jgi:hypothetical protein